MNVQAKRGRKRPQKPEVRAALTVEQEIFEGRTYYSDADIAAVLETFTPRPGLDRADFARRLNVAAWWYVNSTEGALADTAAAPSVMERYWQRLGRRIADPQDIAALQNELQALNPDRRGELETAALDVARRDRGLPDFEGEPIPLPAEGNAPADVMMDWPVGHQLDKAIADPNLRWLGRCVERAGERTSAENTGRGKKPDEPLHMFVRMAIELLHKASAGPVKMPWSDDTDADPDDPNKSPRKGVMLDFLDAALCPLRPNDNRTWPKRYEELYGIIWRLKDDLRPPRPLGKAALAHRRKRTP